MLFDFISVNIRLFLHMVHCYVLTVLQSRVRKVLIRHIKAQVNISWCWVLDTYKITLCLSIIVCWNRIFFHLKSTWMITHYCVTPENIPRMVNTVFVLCWDVLVNVSNSKVHEIFVAIHRNIKLIIIYMTKRSEFCNASR